MYKRIQLAALLEAARRAGEAEIGSLIRGRVNGMQVVLRVVGGKNDGREITVAVPEFVIGRGEEAHLRPTSDLVSRNHTSIKITDGKVVIEDMGSRNGTFVNGERLTKPHTVKTGESLRVGRLQFEVVIDHVKPGNKKPRVNDVLEAAARTASAGKPASIDDSIAGWLVDDEDDVMNDSTKIINSADTIQMKLEDTLALTCEELGKKPSGNDKSPTGSESDSSESLDDSGSESRWGKKKKKGPGKLPPIPKMSQGSSTTAADDVLRKFFNRR